MINYSVPSSRAVEGRMTRVEMCVVFILVRVVAGPIGRRVTRQGGWMHNR